MDRWIYQAFELEARLPGWAQAPYRGAVFILGLVLGWRGKLLLLAIVTAILAQAGVLQGIRILGSFLVIALSAGGAAGIISAIFEPLGRTGRLGEWFRWALTIFGYLAVLSLLLPPVPFALPDPAFLWAAGILSIVGALALVYTDDRGRSRLLPHQFRLVRNLAEIRVAPSRIWEVAEERLERYESQRVALQREIAVRPGAREELKQLLRMMRTDIGHVRNELERFGGLVGADPGSLNEAHAWLDGIEEEMVALDEDP